MATRRQPPARRRQPNARPTFAQLTGNRPIAAPTVAPVGGGTSGGRPSTCPSTAFVEARLVALEGVYAANSDSDVRARAIDAFFAAVPTGCTTPAQNARLQKITSAVDVQATAEAKSLSSGWVDKVFAGLMPILKIGAGGVGLVVTGLALVYVAGRNTAPVAAVKTVAKVATPAGRVASKVAGSTQAGVRRSEARGVKQRAKTNVRARERSEARSGAEDRLRISRGRSGRERVRMTTPKRAAADKAATTSARKRIKRERLKSLKAAS
jgi:hypothetical protein